MTDLLQQN